jgi:hypothetical protein
VGAEWELCAGATDADDALRRIEAERPHRLVVFGPFDTLIATASARYPGMRIVSDRDAPGAIVATSLRDVRGILSAMPRPGGPVAG